MASSLETAVHFGAAPLSVREAGAIATAVLARDEEQAKRIVRGLIVPLGPWSENVLFDLNADIPSLERESFKLVGDAFARLPGPRLRPPDSFICSRNAGQRSATVW